MIDDLLKDEGFRYMYDYLRFKQQNKPLWDARLEAMSDEDMRFFIKNTFVYVTNQQKEWARRRAASRKGNTP